VPYIHRYNNRPKPMSLGMRARRRAAPNQREEVMDRIEVILVRSSLRRREPSPTYNLFQREDKPDLYCAVPEDRAVPTFLRAGSWAFVGRITEAAALPGFQEEQARSGVRLNGFYLFMAHHSGFVIAARSSAPGLCAA
jgi:hypothetical protein